MSSDAALMEALRANVRLDGHEKECAAFRKGIMDSIEHQDVRLSRMEKILITCAGSAILLLLNSVFKVV